MEEIRKEIKECKFKKGDIAYKVNISPQLHVISIIRSIVTNNPWMHEGTNEWRVDVETETIKAIRTHQLDSSLFVSDDYDNELSETQLGKELKISKTISSSTYENRLYTKQEFSISLVKKLLEESRKNRQNFIDRIQNSYYKCFFTGKKLNYNRVSSIFHTYDYHEDVYTVDGEPYRYKLISGRRGSTWVCEYDGFRYEFKLNPDKTFSLIEKVDLAKEEEDRKLEAKRREEERKRKQEENALDRLNNPEKWAKIDAETPKLPNCVRVYAKTVNIENVKVQPLSPPSGFLFYMGPTFENKKETRKVKFLDGENREIENW